MITGWFSRALSQRVPVHLNRILDVTCRPHWLTSRLWKSQSSIPSRWSCSSNMSSAPGPISNSTSTSSMSHISCLRLSYWSMRSSIRHLCRKSRLDNFKMGNTKERTNRSKMWKSFLKSITQPPEDGFGHLYTNSWDSIRHPTFDSWAQ